MRPKKKASPVTKKFVLQSWFKGLATNISAMNHSLRVTRFRAKKTVFLGKRVEKKLQESSIFA